MDPKEVGVTHEVTKEESSDQDQCLLPIKPTTMGGQDREMAIDILHLEKYWDKTKLFIGNSLAVQWLGLHAFTVEGSDSFLGWGTKTLQAKKTQKNKTKQKPKNKNQTKLFMDLNWVILKKQIKIVKHILK